MKHEIKDVAILWKKYMFFLQSDTKASKSRFWSGIGSDRLYRQVNGTANPFAKKEDE